MRAHKGIIVFFLSLLIKIDFSGSGNNQNISLELSFGKNKCGK